MTLWGVRSPDSDLAWGSNDEAPSPALDILGAEELFYVLLEQASTQCRQAEQKDSGVRARLERAHVGEIEVLRDEKPRCPLSGVPGGLTR